MWDRSEHHHPLDRAVSETRPRFWDVACVIVLLGSLVAVFAITVITKM